MILFYGSQTGTAEDFASRFAKDLTDNYGVSTIVCDFDDYDMEELAIWPGPEEIASDDNPTKKWLAGFFLATVNSTIIFLIIIIHLKVW